ncbi:UNVERIFIED_CONTAM: hypothetical protein Slati_2999900 [Sesamum latifolium]|uniref:Reverse transcriptase Ty1/copia-type domain-containing protein n=1 Tax=Sesamum latifolium TaxID=2727402 RepID=A0AAW2VIS7_9LAMI
MFDIAKYRPPHLMILLIHCLLLQLLRPLCLLSQILTFLLLFAKTYYEAVLHPEWKLAMDEKISALISRGTWELVSAPVDANVVSCRWVFTLKYQVDASMIVIRPVWLLKGFAQTYGVDYFEIFSPVARPIPFES